MTNHRSESHSFSVSSTISRCGREHRRAASPRGCDGNARRGRSAFRRHVLRRLGNRDTRADDVRQPLPDRAGSAVLDARARARGHHHRRRDGEPAGGVSSPGGRRCSNSRRDHRRRARRGRDRLSRTRRTVAEISLTGRYRAGHRTHRLVTVQLARYRDSQSELVARRSDAGRYRFVLTVPRERSNIFQLFPVLLLGIVVAWAIAAGLSVLGIFGPDTPGYIDLASVAAAEPVHPIYPLQWGMPSVTPAFVIGMLAGVAASIVESIGDYHAVARLRNGCPQQRAHVSRHRYGRTHERLPG